MRTVVKVVLLNEKVPELLKPVRKALKRALRPL